MAVTKIIVTHFLVAKLKKNVMLLRTGIFHPDSLIQHTFKLKILFKKKITEIHFDWTKLFAVHHKSP